MKKRYVMAAVTVLTVLLPLLPFAGIATDARAQRGSAEMLEKRRLYHNRYINKPAPPFSLSDRAGRTVRLQDLRGRVILLNFWFSTCMPCRKETPALMRLYDAYRHEGLTVIGINLDRILIPQFKGAQMERFLETYHVNYPVLIADEAVFEAYGGVPVQPMTFLIDREGIVDRIFWGASPEAAFDMSLRPLLASESHPAGPATGISSGP